MIRFAPAVVVLLFPLVLTAEDKKEFVLKSKEGRFSVTLPEKPIESKGKASGDDLYKFYVDLNERAYIVAYGDSPGAAKVDPDKLLDGAVAGSVLKGSKLVKEEKITLGQKKYPGREFRIELPDKKNYMRKQVFLVGERLYQVMAIGPDDFDKSKAVDDFFKSFAIDE